MISKSNLLDIIFIIFIIFIFLGIIIGVPYLVKSTAKAECENRIVFYNTFLPEKEVKWLEDGIKSECQIKIEDSLWISLETYENAVYEYSIP